MTLAARLRERRERRNLKNSQVALYLDLSTAHVSNIESGNREPSLELLVKLAEYYRCSVDYLLGMTDDPRPSGSLGMSEAALEAVNLIDTLPPEKRTATVAVLRGIIELMDTGIPLPQPAGVGRSTTEESNASTTAPTWEVGVDSTDYRQLGLAAMEDPTQGDLDRRLALIKRMVPAHVYEYILRLVEQGRALTEEDILYLLEASEHKPLQEIIEHFENGGALNGG